jgi:hypothetical protein
MSLRVYASTALTTILLATQAAAQNAPKPTPPLTIAPAQDTLVTLPYLPNVVTGSTLGWALGLAAGAAVGYAIQPNAGDSYIGASEWWLGAWVGSSVGAAAGAHLANRRHGKIVLSTLGTIAITPVALFVGVPLGDVVPLTGLLVIPAAQIGVSVAIERGTSKRRAK